MDLARFMRDCFVGYFRIIQKFIKIIIRVLLMGKSKYKRDWHKYDENVITRYYLMFPFYVFEH